MNAQRRGLAAFAAQVEHYRLIFRWPERSASLLLPAFFVLAVAVHAAAFFVFQVVYPPVVVSTPPQAHVTLLTAATPQGEALLQWVQAQDPAKAGSIQEITPAGLGEVRYTPSYAAVQTVPIEIKSPAETLALPPSRTLLDLADSPAPLSATSGPRPAVASSLAFSEGLRVRDTTPGAPLALPTKSRSNLRPTVFLVGVGGRGEVLYCFLQTGNDGLSSGDPAMDKQAEALLLEHAFSHSETPLEWGFATFTWGAEAYAQAPPQPPQPEPGK